MKKFDRCLVCGCIEGHTSECSKIIKYIYYNLNRPFLSKRGKEKFGSWLLWIDRHPEKAKIKSL